VSIDPGHVLSGVSCPTVTLCVAAAGSGNVVTSTNPTGGAAAWTVTNIDSNMGLDEGVACTSAVFCAVVGGGDAATSTNPAGGAGAWAVHTITSSAYVGFHMVACATASLCVAGDKYGDLSSSTDPAAGSWVGTGGSGVETVAYDAGSCPATSLCVVGDNYGDVLWSATPGTGPWTTTDLPSLGIHAMSCPSTSLCVGGLNGSVLTSTNPTGDAHEWTITSFGDSTPTRGLSCPTTSFCVAVDAAGRVRIGTAPATPPVVVDSDGDGKPDSIDACPQQAAATADGCPPPMMIDSDGDGKPDSVDACPQQAAATADGCPTAPADVTAPTVKLSGRRSQKLGATVRTTVWCPDEACVATAGGTVRVARVGAARARTYTLKSVTTSIPKDTKAKVILELSSRTRAAIRRALRSGQRITIKLRFRCIDVAGNETSRTRDVRLMR
jgi:hypothetical protein